MTFQILVQLVLLYAFIMGKADRPIRVNVNAAIIRDGKILLIEFNDESGVHFNLPGGGVDPGQSVEEGLERECREEACVDVSVGRMLLVWQYVPEKVDFRYGRKQKVGFVFLCRLKPGSEPAFPKNPDKNQTGVVWIPLADLEKIPAATRGPLFPAIEEPLLASLKMENGPTDIWSEA